MIDFVSIKVLFHSIPVQIDSPIPTDQLSLVDLFRLLGSIIGQSLFGRSSFRLQTNRHIGARTFQTLQLQITREHSGEQPGHGQSVSQPTKRNGIAAQHVIDTMVMDLIRRNRFGRGVSVLKHLVDLVTVESVSAIGNVNEDFRSRLDDLDPDGWQRIRLVLVFVQGGLDGVFGYFEEHEVEVVCEVRNDDFVLTRLFGQVFIDRGGRQVVRIQNQVGAVAEIAIC